MLDIRTLIVSFIATNLVCVIVMTLLWRQNRHRFSGIGYWLGQYIAINVAVVLLALRGVLPDGLSIVVANTLVVAGFVLIYMGVQRFVGQPGSQIHNYVFLALFVLIHTYFTYVQPSLRARNINVSVGMFIGAFEIVWLIFHRVDPGTAADLRGMGIIASLFCLVSVARVIADLMSIPAPTS